MSLNQGRGYTSNVGVLQNGVVVLDPLLQFVGVDFKPKVQGYYLINFVCQIRIQGLPVIENYTTSITKNGGVAETKTLVVNNANAGSLNIDNVITLSMTALANGTSDFFGYVVDPTTTSSGLPYTFNVTRVG